MGRNGFFEWTQLDPTTWTHYCLGIVSVRRSPMDAPKTLSVPDAGRQYFELGRNASYEAARRGDIPTIRIGRKVRVPVVALERMLERVEPRHD
jgi:hypothetical protein